MTIKTSLAKKFVGAAVLLTASSMVTAGWNGQGVINDLFFFPNHAVVVQGSTGGGLANCANEARWSFNWSDFPAATQQRIMSMLLTARTSKQSIQVMVSDTSCGPDGKKKFTGEIQY